MYPAQRRRRAGDRPIPFAVSLAMTFIAEGLTKRQYEREVRRIVRERLPTIREQIDQTRSGELWQEYDARVSEIIDEELARN